MSSSPKILPPGEHRTDYILAALCAGIVFFIAHYNIFSNPLLLNDDVRQQIFWMEGWRTPGLFSDDWLADYARHYVSFGVRGLYWLFSHFMSPLRFSQFLPGILYIFMGICVYGCGVCLSGRATAWAASAVFWFMPGFLYNISGGLARAFAAPLLALFLWGWLARRARMTATALLLAALFIPYIGALCGAALGIAWVVWLLRGPKPPLLSRISHWWIPVVAAAVAYAYSYEITISGYGPMVSAADMAGRPEFGELGRFQVYPTPSLFYELVCRPFERLFPFQELGAALGILCAAGLCIACYLGARRVPWRQLAVRFQGIIFLSCTSILMFYVAKILLLKLFIPSRYLEYTTLLVYTLLIGLCVAPLVRNSGRVGGILLLSCCILLAGVRLHNEALYDYSKDKKLYAAVQTTPKDALFAGNPHTMDNVLAFGQRKVFSSYELIHPWSRGLWKKLEPRLYDFFDAYYAHDPETLRHFVQKYQIDYFIIDKRQFSPDYLEPSLRRMPFYKAAHFPKWLQSLCRSVGLNTKVITRVRSKKEKPGDHPFFEPFGQHITQLANNGKFFAILQEKNLPIWEITPYLSILDVRPLQDVSKKQPEVK